MQPDPKAISTKGAEYAPTASRSPFAAMRHRNYQLYFAGQLVSMAGTWMQSIAQGWLVYQLTKSDASLGLVGFAAAVPAFVVAPWAGVLVDRMSRRTLLLLTQSGAMMLAFILAALTFSGLVTEWHIILLAAGLGFVNSVDSPARQAFVVELVGREDLANGIALNSMLINLARVVGPAIGGVLLAVVGPAWCFTINGISFLAVLLGLAAMRLPAPLRKAASASPWEELKEGVRHLLAMPELLGLVLLALEFSIFGISYMTLLPDLVINRLGRDATAYGWLTAGFGIGAVLGALIVAGRPHPGWRGRWLATASLGFPVLLAVFGWTTYFWLSVVLSIILGLGFMLEFNTINTLLQTNVAERFRGRVLALYTLTFLGFAPFGNLGIGYLAQRFGLAYAISAFSLASLLLALLILRRTPGIAKLP